MILLPIYYEWGKSLDIILNEIGIVQINNQYHFYTENNLYLGAVLLPDNGQLMFDAKTLNIITKALAVRWGIIPMSKRIG